MQRLHPVAQDMSLDRVVHGTRNRSQRCRVSSASVLLGRVRSGFRSQLAVASGELRAVMLGAVLIMAGFGLIVPALPLFAKRFGVGDAGVSLLITSFAAMRLVGNFLVGRALTRHGERAVTVWGALIVGLSSLAAAAAVNYPMLLIFRTLGGIGSAFYFGGLLSYLLARVPPHQRGRATALFQGAVSAGIFVGPVVGGLLIAWRGENFPFAVYGVACLLAAGWSYRTMSKPIHQHATGVKPPNLQVLAGLMKDRSYRISLLVAMMGFVVLMAPQVLLPTLWVDTLDLSKATIGIPFTVTTGAGLLVILHAGHLVDQRGRKGVIVGSAFALAAGLAGLSRVGGFWTVCGAMFVIGAATGYSRPAVTSVLGDVATEENRGVAIGGFRVAQDLGGLIGPAIAGPVSQAFGPRVGFLVIAVVALLVALSTLRLRETAPHLAPRTS